jgi:hypothetical protein
MSTANSRSDDHLLQERAALLAETREIVAESHRLREKFKLQIAGCRQRGQKIACDSRELCHRVAQQVDPSCGHHLITPRENLPAVAAQFIPPLLEFLRASEEFG